MTSSRPTTARTPPGPGRPRNPARWLFPVHGDRLAGLTATARRHGGAARIPHGPVWIYLFTSPELVRETLVVRADDFTVGRKLRATDEFLGDGLLGSGGELHRRQRRLVQPAFHGEAVAGYVDAIAGLAAQTLDAWRPGDTVDARAEIMGLARRVIATVLWGGDAAADAASVPDEVEGMIDHLELATTPAGRVTRRLPTPRVRRARAAAARSRAAVDALIARHREEGRNGAGLLTMLLESTDEAGRPVPDELIRDELRTLLFAGQESVSNALAWTLWLVSQHLEVAAALEDEVDRELGGEPPTAATLGRLAWARQTLQEGMRLYPPAWAVGRTALRETTVGPWRVPAGANVLVSPWVTHRDPEIWPDPARFDPSRFAPEAARSRDRFAYYPFGGGQRTCVGAALSMTEGTIILAMIAQRVRLRWAGDAPPRPRPQITLRPEGGMPMTVEAR